VSNATIDFWFDYSSPYGYLASARIETIAERHGRRVTWRPFLLGAVFKVTGSEPLVGLPMKGDYAWHDFHRSARQHGTRFERPETFPISSVAAARATLWLREHQDPAFAARTADLVHALYGAYYVDGVDIGAPAAVLDSIAGLGLPRENAEAALADPLIKERLKQEVDTALAREVFGSPMIVVDRERFWGHDRLEQVDRWLATGGW